MIESLPVGLRSHLTGALSPFLQVGGTPRQEILEQQEELIFNGGEGLSPAFQDEDAIAVCQRMLGP